MTPAKLEFDRRCEEIDGYFRFLSFVDGGIIVIPLSADPIYGFLSHERENLLRTMKANAFLLLYNLVESTVTNGIESIFDEFEAQSIPFDRCREEVRAIVLNNLKAHSVNNILPSLNRIAIDVVVKTFQKDKIVSGNVDARKIKEMADDYGFVRPSADGRDLLTVKSHRNDLAHGVKSFCEVGRDFVVSDIIAIQSNVVLYLDDFLSRISLYIDQRQYLAVP